MGKKFGLSFSLSRLIGLSTFKRSISRKTGITTTKKGMNEKLGRLIINMFLGKK
jgi:hypothetical protein